jgi:hypothetical protein
LRRASQGGRRVRTVCADYGQWTDLFRRLAQTESLLETLLTVTEISTPNLGEFGTVRKKEGQEEADRMMSGGGTYSWGSTA